jgi:hypothetical protein
VCVLDWMLLVSLLPVEMMVLLMKQDDGMVESSSLRYGTVGYCWYDWIQTVSKFVLEVLRDDGQTPEGLKHMSCEYRKTIATVVYS